MVNRVMAAKGFKLKRQKRLFPRYLSADYMPTGRPPNQLVMRELKARSLSLAFDDEYQQYLDVRNWMNREGLHPHPGREEVKRHIQRVQDVSPSLQCVTICNSLVRKTLLFYNDKHDRFIIFEGDRIEKEFRTSMVYMDKKRCIAAWKSETLRWVHFSSVRPPPQGGT